MLYLGKKCVISQRQVVFSGRKCRIFRVAGGIFGVKTCDFRKKSGISREKMRDFGVKGGIFGVDVFFSSKKWHFRVETA